MVSPLTLRFRRDRRQVSGVRFQVKSFGIRLWREKKEKGKGRRAKSEEQRAESTVHRAWSVGQRAESEEQREL